ncbi:hypothetical protein ACFFWC_03960 [Plantactinospora siamensis]|uniref:DUF7144 domain-containing protein n=1 Tax=Plantactinospora siamensis TaxID=555372 RepID=A0ABV6NR59_9ACTN
MSEPPPACPPVSPAPPDGRRRRVLVAGGLLGGAGLIDVLAGVVTIPVDPYFDVGPSGTYHLDITGWAWVHLAVGAAAALFGLAAAADRHWTSVLAIAAAAGSIGINLLVLPYQPLLSPMVIGLDVAAILLLNRHMRDGAAHPPTAAHPPPAGR